VGVIESGGGKGVLFMYGMDIWEGILQAMLV